MGIRPGIDGAQAGAREVKLPDVNLLAYAHDVESARHAEARRMARLLALPRARLGRSAAIAAFSGA